ncbi:MAG: hypothetical protein NTV03_03140, partial [Candidatus Nomurabacteria bacterium]|nr:hypothetical protein [Candidatus Nomurabacteria bacterium]
FKRNYNEDYDYLSDSYLITERQKKTLYDLISRNFQGDERENRLREIENISSLEAEDEIFQILSASWS